MRPLTRLQRLGVAVLFVLAALVLGAAIVIFSGLYNISARADHWALVDWILVTTRDQSVEAASQDIAVPDLADPDLVALGREHVRGACLTCHATPGRHNNPIYDAMLPAPPDLEHVARDSDAAALFWVVQNGLKYTGMPAWPAKGRKDEVWPVIAFLEDLGREGSAALTPLPAPADAAPSDLSGLTSAPLDNCTRCHGDAERGPISSYVPVLHGQSRAYLARALTEYSDGTRQSGIMAPIAFGMTDGEIAAIAARYAELPPPAAPAPPAPLADAPAADAVIARGQTIAREGLPHEDVPACDACHSGADPDFPRLAGQPENYLLGQLALWREGGRARSSHGRIMAPIAARLDETAMTALAAYYATRTPHAEHSPAPQDARRE